MVAPAMARVKDEEYKRVARRLTLWREAAFPSARAAAEAADVKQTTWCGWENGRNKPDPIKLRVFTLSGLLTYDWLYAGDMSRLPEHIAATIRRAINVELPVRR